MKVCQYKGKPLYCQDASNKWRTIKGGTKKKT